jgi:hypothetical protein
LVLFRRGEDETKNQVIAKHGSPAEEGSRDQLSKLADELYVKVSP